MPHHAYPVAKQSPAGERRRRVNRDNSQLSLRKSVAKFRRQMIRYSRFARSWRAGYAKHQPRLRPISAAGQQFAQPLRLVRHDAH
jgi:hypothetical protein